MMIEITDPDAMVPGGPLEDRHGVFGFEADFAQDLRCIPMVERFKLDRVGIKLSLRQWTKIGQPNRIELAALRCNSMREVMDYRRTLVRMVEQSSSGPIVDLPVDPSPVWADCTRVPSEIAAQAAKFCIDPPTSAQWSQLDTLQRFALVKLARSNHDNHNFQPAMLEFGIVSRLA